MHHHAERADQREGDEAQRQQPAEHLVQQQPGELRQHQRVQLALAGDAFVEMARDFDHPQWRRRTQRQVEQDLEALARSGCRASCSNSGRGSMKKPLIGSLSRTGRNELCQPDAAHPTGCAPATGQPGRVAALDVAAADGKVVLAAAAARRACPAAWSRRAAGRRRSPRRSVPRTTARPRSPPRPGRGGRSRRMQRTRGSVWAMRRTSAVVPSGLLSSTNTTSQAMPNSAASSLATSGATFGRSL